MPGGADAPGLFFAGTMKARLIGAHLEPPPPDRGPSRSAAA